MTEAITDARPRRALRGTLFVAALVVLAILVSVRYEVGEQPPGDELRRDPGSYGWHTSKDVGSILTDGLNLISVTPQARAPLRLISARPLMDSGGAVRMIGILARVNPDMLPPGYKVSAVQSSPGFPPVHPDLAGAVPVNGLIVAPPKPGEPRWIELQIGYEVVAPGRSTRRGVELVYEYEGARHKALIPSYLAVCAPSTATCQPEYDT